MVGVAVTVGAILVHKGKTDPESHLDVIRITIFGGAEQEVKVRTRRMVPRRTDRLSRHRRELVIPRKSRARGSAHTSLLAVIRLARRGTAETRHTSPKAPDA